MTDKIQKIKEFLIGMAGAACCDAKTKKNIETIILPFVDSLQEEPIYTDFTKALAECIHQAQGSVTDPMVFAELWKDELIKLAKSEEPVSEDLEEAANDYAVTVYNNYLDNPKAFFENKDADTLNEDAFKAGAKWHEQQIMKDAVEVKVKVDAGGYPYVDRVIELYDYEKDIPLAKEGDKYKVILIKTD